MARIIDADSHFMEPPTLYRDHIAPSKRELAIEVIEDERGWPWLAYKGRPIHFIDQHVPARPDLLGERRRQYHTGARAVALASSVEDACDPAARLRAMDANGTDAAIAFTNLGLLWEDALRDDIPAMCANFEAYNTWTIERLPSYEGRLFPAAQLTLRDLEWFHRELERCAHAGIRLAMIGPHPVGERALAHPDFDPVWAAFQDHDVAVAFHVARSQPPLDPAWYALDPEPMNKVLDNVFLYLAPAVAATSLIVHGKLEQFPGLRIGIFELSSRWVPEYLLHLDGGFEFYKLQKGRPLTQLPLMPSEYFRRQVRVAALAAEGAAELIWKTSPDLYMWSSDYPHVEGMATPSWREYESMQPRALGPGEREALAGTNAAFLLGLAD
jgi:predicted TIM-barrel fold metal-dependent hydrolase